MKKKIVVLLAIVALAIFMPIGTAFALNSPQLNSPQLNSPQLNSPQLNSPQLNSPQLNSPQLNSPQLNSPQLNSPQLNSPQLNSPQLDAPQLSASQSDDPQPQLDEAQSQTSIEGAENGDVVNSEGVVSGATGVVSYAAANTVSTHVVEVASKPSASTGVVLSPNSGAPNLAVIASLTGIALVGAVGGSLVLMRALRKE